MTNIRFWIIYILVFFFFNFCCQPTIYIYIYGWGSTASRLEPFWGGSLIFTSKFPKIPATHFTDLGGMKGWVDLGATQWFWSSTEPFILPRSVKWVPGISGNSLGKSKLAPQRGASLEAIEPCYYFLSYKDFQN